MSSIAFLFPGQGSQYVGMCKTLCVNFPVADFVFEKASDILNINLKKICFDSDSAELTKTYNTQPAILTASMACYKVYMQEYGIPPIICAGHSLGEISALVCSGVISFKDGLKIVKKRGELMQNAAKDSDCAMAAIIGLERNVAEEICTKVSGIEKNVVISNYNSQDQIVISGHKETVKKFVDYLYSYDVRVTFLKVSAAFHSPLMESIVDEFRDELESYLFHLFRWPVVSNVSGLPYNEPALIIDKLTQQLVSPVQWKLTMDYIEACDISIAVEMGPKNVLKSFFRSDCPLINVYSMDKTKDILDLESALKSKNIILKKEKKDYKSTIYSKCLEIAASTRNRNLNDIEFSNGVTKSINILKEMQKKTGQSSDEISEEQLIYALKILKNILNTKKVSKQEQVYRFSQILDDIRCSLTIYDILN